MITLLRKIRKNLLTENRFSKYLLYAIGEIVLVVIGILIALQINNWNQNKIQNIALKGYLTSISNNIKTDLENIDYLITSRINTVTNVPVMNWELRNSNFLKRDDIKYGSEILTKISKFEYFNADLSGFESIKSSGYLSKLNGQDIESLIYKYYNLVQEITAKEKDYNDILRNAYVDFSSQGFENFIYVTYPNYIGDENELKSLQADLRKIFFHPSARSLYRQTIDHAPELIVKYENLQILGKEITRIIDNNLPSMDTLAANNLDNMYNPKGSKGYAKVVTNGSTFNGYSEMGNSQSDNRPVVGYRDINEYYYSLPDIEWVVVYFTNPSSTFDEKPAKDFSDYQTLKLELKSDTAGKTIYIALKDKDDLDDGKESRVPIVLTSEWKTYEISLSEFKTANLEELFVVTSFLSLNSAVNLSIKTIEFVR